jgi:cytochrome c oxidase subunit III
MEQDLTNKIQVFHPRKFIVWILIVSSLMAFAGLTSAFIVMKSQGNKGFSHFELPPVYMLSTIVVLISSIVLHVGYNFAKKNKISSSKLLVLVTFLLGLGFVFLQVEGFSQLISNHVHPIGTQSPWNHSLTFVIICFHMFHLFIAMLVLILLLIKSFSDKVFNKNIVTFHNCVVFWHFLGILWVFLYSFLYISL